MLFLFYDIHECVIYRKSILFMNEFINRHNLKIDFMIMMMLQSSIDFTINLGVTRGMFSKAVKLIEYKKKKFKERPKINFFQIDLFASSNFSNSLKFVFWKIIKPSVMHIFLKLFPLSHFRHFKDIYLLSQY